MRFFILIQTVVVALAFAAFGIFAFLKIRTSQRKLADKMQRIHAGEVQPETLTVIRKYTARSRRSSKLLVYYQDSHHAEVHAYASSQSFYDDATPGDKVIGYSFPDGYLIPQALAPPSRLGDYVPWFFLASGLFSGAIIFLFALYRFMFARLTATSALASISDDIRQRRNQSSGL